MVRRHPGARVEVWAQDEARLGLKPIVRRRWARRGLRPVARQRPRYEWLYLYAFARPATGDVHWLIMPTVSTIAFQLALDDFAKTVGAGAQKQVVLVLDGAGWHASKELRPPEGIHLLFLPPYSPELQPAERLWPLVHEALANQPFPTLSALKDRVAERCRELDKDPTRLKRYTGFHWWPQER